MLEEGHEYAVMLYTWRSCSRAIPQVTHKHVTWSHTYTRRPPFISSVCFHSESTRLHTFIPAITKYLRCLSCDLICNWFSPTYLNNLLFSSSIQRLNWLYLQTRCCSVLPDGSLYPPVTTEPLVLFEENIKFCNDFTFINPIYCTLANLRSYISALETMVVNKSPMGKLCHDVETVTLSRFHLFHVCWRPLVVNR